MDKNDLLRQLGERLREAVQKTHRASEEARLDARSGAARAVNLALGHGQRSVASREALDALETFRPGKLRPGQPIGLGAVVELEEEDGQSGKTLFIAPVGAGEELTGPGGDGILHVATPVSPFGRAVMGKRVGEVVEVTVSGEATEWSITFAA